MAAGVRARLGVDVGVAVTGVAGPDGGTDDKPVGLVFVHASGPGRREGRAHGAPRRPRDDSRARDGRGTASRSSLVGESSHGRVSAAATVEGDDALRLFLALELPRRRGRRSSPAGASRRAARWPSRHDVPRHARLSRPDATIRARRDPRRPARGGRDDRVLRARARPATGRRARSGWSSSPIRADGRPASPGACTVGWSGSACTCPSAGRGSRTSPCCGSARDRSWSRRSPISARSLHPGSLLSFHVCARQGRGTRFSNRVR